jgi:hypothetical protein
LNSKPAIVKRVRSSNNKVLTVCYLYMIFLWKIDYILI